MFKDNNKTYYFSPNGFEINVGDNVIVETARGVEYGNVVLASKKISEEEIEHIINFKDDGAGIKIINGPIRKNY